MERTQTLESLARAAGAGEWPHVLTGLLSAWREAPNRELADRVAAVGAKVAAPLSGAWEAVARTPDPTVLSMLLDTLLAKGSVKARTRLELLEAWPADPRIDRWVAERYADPPFSSTAARPFWTRLAPLARRIRDARAVETLTQARAGYDREVAWEEFLAGHLDRVLPMLGTVADAELPAGSREALAAIDEALREASRPVRAADAETLLAQVLAKPEDDEARAVLADVLLEAGHPRGELIALQLEAARRPLTPAETRRERRLLKTARKELLGPLDAVLKPGCTFSRGFLSRAALKQGISRALWSAIEKTVGHPLWATVEHLEGGGDKDITPHEVMRSLRSLAHSDVRCETLARLPGLEVLVDSSGQTGWPELARDEKAFPKLRELDRLIYPREAREFLRSPLVARLERLQVRLELPAYNASAADEALELLALVPELKVRGLTFRLVRNRTHDWSSGLHFVRGVQGRLSVHVFTTAMSEPYEELVQDDVLRALDSIAGLQPVSLTLAHQLKTRFKTDVERRARELGAVLD